MSHAARSAAPLTTLQRQVLDYMRLFLLMNHELPPRWKIAADFGWSSPNAAECHLKYLEDKGMLERNEIGNLMLSQAAVEGAS